MSTNTIDELMSRLEEDPTSATPKDIDDIIAYQRKARANYESGVKPKKGGDGPRLEPSELLTKLGLGKPVEQVKRRI